MCFNMLWRYGAVGEARQTVNLFLRVSWFESSYLHHNIEENCPGDVMVAMRVLEARVERRVGSSPTWGTKLGSVAESGLWH